MYIHVHLCILTGMPAFKPDFMETPAQRAIKVEETLAIDSMPKTSSISDSDTAADYDDHSVSGNPGRGKRKRDHGMFF